MRRHIAGSMALVIALALFVPAITPVEGAQPVIVGGLIQPKELGRAPLLGPVWSRESFQNAVRGQAEDVRAVIMAEGHNAAVADSFVSAVEAGQFTEGVLAHGESGVMAWKDRVTKRLRVNPFKAAWGYNAPSWVVIIHAEGKTITFKVPKVCGNVSRVATTSSQLPPAPVVQQAAKQQSGPTNITVTGNCVAVSNNGQNVTQTINCPPPAPAPTPEAAPPPPPPPAPVVSPTARKKCICFWTYNYPRWVQVGQVAISANGTLIESAVGSPAWVECDESASVVTVEVTAPPGRVPGRAGYYTVSKSDPSKLEFRGAVSAPAGIQPGGKWMFQVPSPETTTVHIVFVSPGDTSAIQFPQFTRRFSP